MESSGLNSGVSYRGTITVKMNGIVLFKKSNKIVTSGLNLAAVRLGANTQDPIGYIGVGADATAPVAGNTTLGNQLDARIATSFSPAGAVGTWEATFPAGASTGTIAEAGLFNAAAGGTMFSRVVFGSAIPKTATDSITITWTVEAQEA